MVRAGQWRKLVALLTHLPPESATVRAIVGHSPWTQTDYLLAALLDTARAGNWQRGGGKGRRPRPIPRPGEGPKHYGSESMTPAEFDAALARIQEGGDD